MCGLVFSTTPQPRDSARWRQAMRVLDCRGPDARNEVHGGSFSAGHCRLEIIGLGEAGRQPYSRSPQDDLLVFNGEIYNYRELASTLGIDADSDTHVVYHLLSSGQLDRLSELRGMFAFVYWRRDTGEITVGRDLFGIKPLYVAQSADGSPSFASVPAALLPLREVREEDPVAIAGFVATGYFPTGSSPFAAIEKCATGTISTWREVGGSWITTSTTLRPPPGHLSTLAAVTDSVRAHLVADVQVGVLLSGGVDSTLVAACAAQQVDQITTFSLINPLSPDIDESGYARWNAALLGSRHVEVAFEPADSMEVLRSLVRTCGEPFGDAAYVPLAFLCRRVAEDLKVVLAGEGADELFGGYRRYQVERLRRLRLTGAPLRGVSRAIGAPRRYLNRAPDTATRSWAHWSQADDYLAYSYLLSAEWQAMAAAAPDATRTALARYRATWTDYRTYDITQWLPNVFLEKSDRASMLSGVEVRVPYLDPAVARAAMEFEPKDSRKTPLREALLKVLPDARLPERKMGLSVDIPRLMAGSGLDEYARYCLTDPKSVLQSVGIVDVRLLQQRAGLNSALAFRLGMLALWQHEVLEAKS